MRRSLILFLFCLPSFASAEERVFRDNSTTPFPNAKPMMTRDSCTYVNLAPKMGMVRAQAGNSCYAHAAIELLNFGTTKQFSATHLAGIYTYDDEGEIGVKNLDLVEGFNGGNPQKALEIGMKHGLCPDEAIPPIISPKINQKNLYEIVEYFNKVKGINSCPANDTLKDKAKALLVGFADFFETQTMRKEFLLKKVRDSFPHLKPLQVEELLDRSPDVSTFVRGLIDKSCAGKLVKVPVRKVKYLTTVDLDEQERVYFTEEKRARMMAHINEAMDQGRPVIIGHHTHGLTIMNGQGRLGHHATPVTGREWLEEERDESGKVIREAGCYYQVKNSFGSKWKVPAGVKAFSSNTPGYFVVSEKAIMEHAYATATLE